SGLRFYQSCHSKPWSTENSHFGQRNDNELQILEDAYSKARYMMEAINSIPSSDRWTDGAIEPDTETVPTMLCRPGTRQLGFATTFSPICLQFDREQYYENVTILRQLWIQP